MKTTQIHRGDSLYITEDLAGRLDAEDLVEQPAQGNAPPEDFAYTEPENDKEKQKDCSLYIFFEDEVLSPIALDGILSTFSGGQKGWLIEVDEIARDECVEVIKRMSCTRVKTIHVHHKRSSLMCMQDNVDVTIRFGSLGCNVSISSDTSTAI